MELRPLLFCLLIAWPSFAQEHIVSLKDAGIDFDPWPVNVKEVIDLRPNQSNIGWVQKGMTNIRMTADFPIPLEVELLEFLNANAVATNEAPNLILRIKELLIYESTGVTSEKGIANITMEFIMEKDQRLYRVIEISETVERKGLDVTRKHPENIANAIATCVDKFLKLDLSDPTAYALLSPTEILLRQVNANPEFERFNVDRQEGVFENFTQLKQNNPAITQGYRIKSDLRKQKNWEGTFNRFPVTSEGKRIKKIWGFSHNDTVYIAHQGEFFPVIFDDNEIYFIAYDQPNIGATSGAAVAGGLIGGGIAGGIDAARLRKQRIEYHVDPYTGIVTSPYHLPTNLNSNQKVDVVFYRLSKKEQDVALALVVNDSLVGSFPPLSYVKLNYPVPIESMKVCVGESTCIEVHSNDAHTKYYRFSLPKNANSPVITQEKTEVGEYYSKQAKHFQDKRMGKD